MFQSLNLTSSQKNKLATSLQSLSKNSPNKNSALSQLNRTFQAKQRGMNAISDSKDIKSNEVWKKLYKLVQQAYKGYGQIVEATNRFYKADNTWEAILKIVNTLPKPKYSGGKDGVIREVRKIKSVTTSQSGESSAADDYGGYSDDGAENSSTTDNNASGTSNPMLSGERTFQEIIGEICEGIDLIFLCKRNVVVVTDFETLYAEADYLRKQGQVESEDIKLWQLEDGTYELDINQYGMYNTVKIIYKNGVVTESYPDLVRVYGEVIDLHSEKGLSKTQAQQKAKAYLAAHLRDFNMTIKASVLHDGGIDIGDIVTIENPLTLKNEIKKIDGELPEYYFVNGISVDWDEGPIKCDLELTYAPESPEKPEVPETGASYMNVQQTDNVGESENEDYEASL